jgi:hypothetical protein
MKGLKQPMIFPPPQADEGSGATGYNTMVRIRDRLGKGSGCGMLDKLGKGSGSGMLDRLGKGEPAT